jgi:hypothetical protein
VRMIVGAIYKSLADGVRWGLDQNVLGRDLSYAIETSKILM